MPEPGDHLRCACVQAGDEGVNHLHCEPSPDHADDPENREGALMARRNLKEIAGFGQLAVPIDKSLARCVVSLTQCADTKIAAVRAVWCHAPLSCPPLNCKISNDFRRSLSVAHYHRMTPLLRSITISLVRTRYMADPASSNGRCAKSMQRTRSLPAQMRVILAFSWCTIERSLPSDQLDFCHEQTPIGA